MQKTVDWILAGMSWLARCHFTPVRARALYLSDPPRGGGQSHTLVALVSDRNLAAPPAGGNVGFVKL